MEGELASDTEGELFHAVMCAVELHSEVVNGGFNQYYFNSGGDRADCARRTFDLLGADRIADLVKRANACCATNRDRLNLLWVDRTKKGFLASYKEKFFDSFDTEYCALMENDQQLYTLIGTYIKQHPQEFLSVGENGAQHQIGK